MQDSTVTLFMEALVGHKLSSLTSLCDGYRIARVLEGLDKQYFSFFEPGTRKSLHLDAESLKKENREITRIDTWTKIVKGMMEFFRAKKQENSKQYKILNSFINVFENSGTDLVINLSKEAEETILYFCMIFILFVK